MSALSSSGSVFASSAACFRAPRVWTRRGSATNNVLAVGSDVIFIGSVRRSRLADVQDELEACRPPQGVLGPKAISIAMHTVRSVEAPVSRPELAIEYACGSRRWTTFRVEMNDCEAQVDALEEIQRQLGPGAPLTRNVGNRWLHACKPMCLVVMLVLFGAGFDYLARESYGVGGETQESAQGPEPAEAEAHTGPRLVRLVACPEQLRPAMLTATTATGYLLMKLGYESTLSMLGGAAVVTCIWSLARFVNPPVTIRLESGVGPRQTH